MLKLVLQKKDLLKCLLGEQFSFLVFFLTLSCCLYCAPIVKKVKQFLKNQDNLKKIMKSVHKSFLKL